VIGGGLKVLKKPKKKARHEASNRVIKSGKDKQSKSKWSCMQGGAVSLYSFAFGFCFLAKLSDPIFQQLPVGQVITSPFLHSHYSRFALICCCLWMAASRLMGRMYVI
jgi:hypothetical protein